MKEFEIGITILNPILKVKFKSNKVPEPILTMVLDKHRQNIIWYSERSLRNDNFLLL